MNIHYFIIIAFFLLVSNLNLEAQNNIEQSPQPVPLCIHNDIIKLPIQPPPSYHRDIFLHQLQYRSFCYFWELANPENGLIPDRYPTPSFCSIAAVGFGLSSYIVGVERGWITRQQAASRVLLTLRFFYHSPQNSEAINTTGYQGFYYHFLDMKTGHRYANVELSTIDTTLLVAGILSCQTYFDQDNPIENEIRDLADQIYRRINWQWCCPRAPLVSMGWHPETGFIPSDWEGYNEAMILYLLALGSPTYPLPESTWQEWTKTYVWGEYYGQRHVQFSPLFGHQYSHIWCDFRYIQDDYMRQKNSTYFANSRAACYAQQAYCKANPQGWLGYSDMIWGLTASDGPADVTAIYQGKSVQFHSYFARGVSLIEECDDGTIAPTAAGGSIPFAPEICIPALKAMHQQYGDKLWGEYGFYDAFNPSYGQHGWVDHDYLGIDNGPIVLMIENHYTGLIWNIMQKNPYLQKGLQRAGFRVKEE